MSYYSYFNNNLLNFQRTSYPPYPALPYTIPYIPRSPWPYVGKDMSIFDSSLILLKVDLSILSESRKVTLLDVGTKEKKLNLKFIN